MTLRGFWFFISFTAALEECSHLQTVFCVSLFLTTNVWRSYICSNSPNSGGWSSGCLRLFCWWVCWALLREWRPIFSHTRWKVWEQKSWQGWFLYRWHIWLQIIQYRFAWGEIAILRITWWSWNKWIRRVNFFIWGFSWQSRWWFRWLWRCGGANRLKSFPWVIFRVRFLWVLVLWIWWVWCWVTIEFRRVPIFRRCETRWSGKSGVWLFWSSCWWRYWCISAFIFTFWTLFWTVLFTFLWTQLILVSTFPLTMCCRWGLG